MALSQELALAKASTHRLVLPLNENVLYGIFPTVFELFLSTAAAAQTSPILLPVSLREHWEAVHCSGGTIPGLLSRSQALQEQGLRPGGLHQSRPQMQDLTATAQS